MKKEKLTQILSGIILVVLGILVAIFGTGAFDLYFGIVAVASGAVLLAYVIYLLSKKQQLAPSFFVIPAVLLTVGICLLVNVIGFGALVKFLVVLILGLGGGILFYGIYLLCKKDKFSGLLNLIIGIAIITVSILYLTVPEFETAFWVIVGCVIAVYGVLEIVSAFVEKK